MSLTLDLGSVGKKVYRLGFNARRKTGQSMGGRVRRVCRNRQWPEVGPKVLTIAPRTVDIALFAGRKTKKENAKKRVVDRFAHVFGRTCTRRDRFTATWYACNPSGTTSLVVLRARSVQSRCARLLTPAVPRHPPPTAPTRPPVHLASRRRCRPSVYRTR